jgi:hypothetical protein
MTLPEQNDRDERGNRAPRRGERDHDLLRWADEI